MPRFTYTLYQNNFDRLAEIIALMHLGLWEEAQEELEDILETDRGEFFDGDVLTTKINRHKKRLMKIRPDLVDHTLETQ